jgi:ferric-chelate reductase
LPQSNKEFEETRSDSTYLAMIGGPYGASHSDPAAFDTVFMISCSTGITFMLSNLLSLAHRSQSGIKLPLRVLDFIWVVKQVSWTSWVAEELTAAVTSLQANGIEVKVTVHVTCDTGEGASDCGCDLSLGPCCCETDVQEANTIEADDFTALEDENKSQNEKTVVRGTGASSQTSNDVVVKSDRTSLPFATFVSGRPNLNGIVWNLAEQAEGEMGIYACGPLGLSTEIRNTVASVSDERAVHKGTGAEGIYLHVESFCW